jgi:pyruvate/2-oxoglutarate dehydrogenase complex dihydrolipoamide acyltransferase (E2) component
MKNLDKLYIVKSFRTESEAQQWVSWQGLDKLTEDVFIIRTDALKSAGVFESSQGGKYHVTMKARLVERFGEAAAKMGRGAGRLAGRVAEAPLYGAGRFAKFLGELPERLSRGGQRLIDWLDDKPKETSEAGQSAAPTPQTEAPSAQTPSKIEEPYGGELNVEVDAENVGVAPQAGGEDIPLITEDDFDLRENELYAKEQSARNTPSESKPKPTPPGDFTAEEMAGLRSIIKSIVEKVLKSLQ